MNFDQDYIGFIESLKKKNPILASPVLCRVERVAVKCFVKYLNKRYVDISNELQK